MNVGQETRRKMRDMGADELLDALLAQDEAVCMGMPSGQRIQMAVDEAHAGYVADKIRNLVKRANLRYPQADVRRIGHAEERGPGCVLIGELATCGFATRGQDVVLFGPAGAGKTYLACALAKEACASRMRTNYIRCPDFEETWKDAQERPGGVAKAVRKHGAFQVLVLDEWLLSRPDDGFRRFLLEISGLRREVDDLLHPVPAEGLACPARCRCHSRGDHGPHRPQDRVGRHGRDEHACCHQDSSIFQSQILMH